MTLAMTKPEREAFLAETRVAVISIVEDGRGPLTVPVWYDYESGGPVRFVTGGGSKKAALLRKAGRMSLCVQTETPPYKYLSLEGPITIGEPDFERDHRHIAHKYLGAQMGEAYLAMTESERDGSILVTLRPERWLSVDYTKMGIAG
jgi:PPOX class probable F420-dependent enzyme